MEEKTKNWNFGLPAALNRAREPEQGHLLQGGVPQEAWLAPALGGTRNLAVCRAEGTGWASGSAGPASCLGLESVV